MWTSRVGYLGSGKSTLVRYILTAEHGFRIAVIVNEYGDSSGIEQSVIEAPDVITLYRIPISHFPVLGREDDCHRLARIIKWLPLLQRQERFCLGIGRIDGHTSRSI